MPVTQHAVGERRGVAHRVVLILGGTLRSRSMMLNVRLRDVRVVELGVPLRQPDPDHQPLLVADPDGR